MKTLSLILILLASTAYADVMYTWTDAKGARHYVSSQDDIPARYRTRAKAYDVATGRKMPISAAPAATQTAPAGQPGTAQPNPAPGATQPPQVVQPPQPAPVIQPGQPAPAAQQRQRGRRSHVTNPEYD